MNDIEMQVQGVVELLLNIVAEINTPDVEGCSVLESVIEARDRLNSIIESW